MSDFTEGVFAEFANQTSTEILLSKCNFKKLIRFVEPSDFPPEVTKKLDMIVNYLT